MSDPSTGEGEGVGEGEGAELPMRAAGKRQGAEVPDAKTVPNDMGTTRLRHSSRSESC